MSDDTEEHSSGNLASAREYMPVYEIPSDLIDKWQAIPTDQKFAPTLPRIAWDRLYRSIEMLSWNVSQSNSLTINLVTGKTEGVMDLLHQIHNHSRMVQNSLRQFQAFMMQAAVDEIEERKIDGE